MVLKFVLNTFSLVAARRSRASTQQLPSACTNRVRQGVMHLRMFLSPLAPPFRLRAAEIFARRMLS